MQHPSNLAAFNPRDFQIGQSAVGQIRSFSSIDEGPLRVDCSLRTQISTVARLLGRGIDRPTKMTPGVGVF
jgi:hypothetical protein